MLYRESYYTSSESEEELNNLDCVELIISKQRNRPIGTIDLYFDSSRTKFLNLD